MANPFFSGRIPQELYDRIDQHIKESGEGKTQILINALSQYLGVEISKPKSNSVNTDLFLTELESLKERVSLLERSHSQQLSLLSSNNSSDNRLITSDNKSDNSVFVHLPCQFKQPLTVYGHIRFFRTVFEKFGN